MLIDILVESRYRHNIGLNNIKNDIKRHVSYHFCHLGGVIKITWDMLDTQFRGAWNFHTHITCVHIRGINCDYRFTK